jgi:3-methyl-2-oxobutanoate hydroxymethyltransferase
MSPPRVRITELKARKARGEKIAVLTAYDAAIARLLEIGGVDILLVGDSIGTAVLGFDSTIPVTLDIMVEHTAAVVRGTKRALVIADMPFLTYQTSIDDAVLNAGRLIRNGSAAAVKLEGGRVMAPVVRRLVEVGIPVMGHIGLVPQSVHQLGGYRQRGVHPPEADALVADALALQDAGAFAVVIESVPAELAGRITRQLDIPTIGIGAGPDCSGQVLVSYDMLGLLDDSPPFAKVYARLAETIVSAAASYLDDVRDERFPVRTTSSVGTSTQQS